ncbi:unnamed protein product [Microthlaspi erraticum]|uniref:Reverse transcriptase Ty1/copia-type domain-containing protein n=1 Tax=Microthlaspi erraticum TaxID=1685480 RepID=A0A6D2I8A4_9BRAS|nr:unnamed protein product [Microthlaspi erraticum]
MVTVKMILALAAKKGWILHQLDISNAFLNGDITEEIYMDLPPGYAERKGDSIPANAVLRLKKSLYGLKQASRQWFLKFSSVLIGLGFQKIHGNHTLFLSVTDSTYMAILVYVDDILVANSRESAVADFVVSLQDHFKLRDWHKYVLELLRESGLTGCMPSYVPIDPSNKLSSESGDLLPDAEVYRRLVGKLMYLTITRPDISFAVNKICQFSSAPRTAHLKAAHRVLHYLKGTIGQSLFYPADNDSRSRLFAVLIMPNALILVVWSVVFAFSLVSLSSLGNRRNSKLSLSPLLKLSTQLCPSRPMKSCGFLACFLIRRSLAFYSGSLL